MYLSSGACLVLGERHSNGKHAIILLDRGHANLYNGIPLSLNAKPQ
jgi:hypothetical protein